MRTLLTVGAALLLALPAAATAAPTTDEPLGSAAGVRAISAGAGKLVIQRGGNVLAERRAGSDVRLGIGSPRALSGYDVGFTSAGRPAVVYSACAASPSRKRPRCDIRLLDLASGKRRGLGLSRGACDEERPRLDRGTVVFTRRARRSRTRRLRCSGGLFVQRPGKRLKRMRRSAPAEFDAGSGHVALGLRRLDPDDESVATTIYEIRLQGYGAEGSRRVVRGVFSRDRGDMTTGEAHDTPAIDGGYVLWARATAQPPDAGDLITQRPPRQDIARRSLALDGPVQALDRTGRGYVSDGDDGVLTALTSDGGRPTYVATFFGATTTRVLMRVAPGAAFR